jgi:hypothetical protein
VSILPIAMWPRRLMITMATSLRLNLSEAIA